MQDPRTIITDDNVENNGSYADEGRLVNPRDFGREDDIEEDEEWMDDTFGEDRFD